MVVLTLVGVCRINYFSGSVDDSVGGTCDNYSVDWNGRTSVESGWNKIRPRGCGQGIVAVAAERKYSCRSCARRCHNAKSVHLVSWRNICRHCCSRCLCLIIAGVDAFGFVVVDVVRHLFVQHPAVITVH